MSNFTRLKLALAQTLRLAACSEMQYLFPKPQGEANMEWRASHILVKDRNLAEELRKRIRGGASFSAIAKEYSQCPSKGKGGDLGWFAPGSMVKPFEDAVRKLSNGGLSGIVSTSFGFHIIKKTGER